ncbi:MAG: xylulose 5-phosphate 3-epimerase [Planctomycetes bacterium]|nr:xylulose 5-phosphate 3-epimerase [Planctomycetota bacterium]
MSADLHSGIDELRMAEQAELCRNTNPAFARWAAGYGPIQHEVTTQCRVKALADLLASRGMKGDGTPLFDSLFAADRLACAAMWLVVHETYAQNVYLDGRDLGPDDFKPKPEGHTGGALNMVPAYVAYLAANAITGHTRAWLMGQGHTVAAIDSVNLLVGNMTPAHPERYALTDEALTRYVRDFYSYELSKDGKQKSPLGSHVNANTAGGISEGGYLGFAELQYVHMPLPGERLVVFLSDGAFEEQRGSDWASRWWRAEDSGIVTPIMIANGRRIDQRTTMSQQGGIEWFVKHLDLNGFDPQVFDGRDPAAFVCTILEMEDRLDAWTKAVASAAVRYPIPLPYGIAVAPKGYGFFGAGTNLAHNLPLGRNPHEDAIAASRFNQSVRDLWVPKDELVAATAAFQHHDRSRRVRERDHALATRNVSLSTSPTPAWCEVAENRRDPAAWTRRSPMVAIDDGFLAAVQANPHLRPRVGNPDEMKSNRMVHTLEALHFRVTDPEPGIPESVNGAVITALNEEAVAAAALANKGGINIAVTYEAFGAKMHGVIRQEVIFANHLAEAGRPARWLSVPIVLTSHTWENGKNEQSHQDPSLAEMLGNEVAPASRVLFPADANMAAAVMSGVFRTQGQIWTLVVSKADSIPCWFTPDEAQQCLRDGAIRIEWAGFAPDKARVVLAAIGSYQLVEVLRASAKLAERKVEHAVVYVLEPGRFRAPRSEAEETFVAAASVRDAIFSPGAKSIVVLTHTRPEPMAGVLAPILENRRARVLGYTNHGGTLSTDGLLAVNRASWSHVVEAAS